MGLVEDLVRFNSLPGHIRKMEDPITGPGLAICITEYCTLNCRDCLVKIPFYRSRRHIDLNELKLWVDNLFLAFDYITELTPIGGETFLYPDLPLFLKYVYEKHHDKVGFVDIFTNSIKLPSDEQLDALVYTKSSIIVSDYGDLSKTKDQLISICETRGIRCTVQNRHKWIDIKMNFKQNQSRSEVQHRFNDCTQAVCYIIANGALYPCSPSAFHTKLGIIPDNTDNYIDCTKPVERDELSKFLSRNRYFDACLYCSGGSYVGNTIPSAIQAEGNIPYKRYDE